MHDACHVVIAEHRRAYNDPPIARDSSRELGHYVTPGTLRIEYDKDSFGSTAHMQPAAGPPAGAPLPWMQSHTINTLLRAVAPLQI